jgi:L-ribulose-5-phosphate 4-epimerase
MLEKLKESVLKGNLDLVKHNLVIFTWGNVSGYDPDSKLMVIKPSGIKYEDLTIENMVVVDLKGNVVEGDLKPSSDTYTHLEIYKNFENIQGIVHTHSKWATSFAQAKIEIVPLGTTHADYFSTKIHVTRPLNKEEILADYEKNTGKVIVELFVKNKLNPTTCPSVLVNEHGPFSWGENVDKAVNNAVVLEYVAEMAYYSKHLNSSLSQMDKELLNKHYNRKHGKNSYYGQ